MKKALINTLKILLPLVAGVWLVIYFYEQLEPAQRVELFDALRQADLRWLFATLLLGWASHVCRAWRWRYLLSPLGHRPAFWNSYHAVMIGYFVNMLLPRAGEASRGLVLYRTDKVPFDKGFGTILAERAIDALMLVLIGAFTLVVQRERLDILKQRLAIFRGGQGEATGSGSWFWWVVLLLVITIVAVAYFLISRPHLRARTMDLVRGFLQGLRSVFLTREKGPFLLFTSFIWSLYLAMFWAGFFCLPETAKVGADGVFAGFIAGSIAIIVVQGGIGAYPAFVALVVSMYMAEPAGGGLIRPDALAMGWLLWTVQTLMIIVLGGVSLLLTARSRNSA